MAPQPLHDLICRLHSLTETGSSVTVEWVRDAPWDEHWATVYHGAGGQCADLSREASYKDACRYAQRLVDYHKEVVW